jgi:hypothetical protein
MSLRHFARGAISAENSRRLMMLRGFTPNGHRLWNGVEASNLFHGYPDYPAVMVLNIRRTRSAHYGKAQRMGITSPRGRSWTDNEILRLHRLFPHTSKIEITDALPGRTWKAICARAHKDGYRRPKRPLRPTGCLLLDQILERARRKDWTLGDLDRQVRGRGYFQKRGWRHGGFNDSLHGSAVHALGGHLRARWRA